MDLTPEALQNISVKVVSSYMLKQASLSEAIAGEAKNLELNPEQIKRVIESSNTVAYLRQLEDAPNRSDLEFPVATYNDVMGRMVLPGQNDPVITKSAAVKKPILPNPLDESAPETQINSSITEQEKQAMLVKETLRVKQTLTKMAEDGYVTANKLEKVAANFVKDPLAFEKLAHVASKEDLRLLVELCKFDLTKEASEGSVFRNEDLKEAITLNSLFKEARAMVLDYKQKEDFVKRASTILLEKKSDEKTLTDRTAKAINTGITKTLGPVAEGAGAATGWVGNQVGRGAIRAARSTGKGIRFMIEAPSAGGVMARTGDLAAGVLGATEIEHKNPVWKSING